MLVTHKFWFQNHLAKELTLRDQFVVISKEVLTKAAVLMVGCI